jgi:hypothetical protein
MVLGNKRIITPPEEASGNQADCAEAEFSEIECMCGTSSIYQQRCALGLRNHNLKD